MDKRSIMGIIMRTILGTDEEMQQPHSRKELHDKIIETQQNIDKMREAADRIAKLQPAKSLDEALHQIVGERR